MKHEEAMQILQMYKDEMGQRIDKANAPEVKDVYQWQMNGFNMAIDALKQTAWIPVGERLPEFDVKVLAYVENKDSEKRFNKDGVYTAELKDKEPVHDPEGKKNIWGIPGFDSEWTVWAWSYFSEPNVVAWKPLPEPYEGGDEE